MYECVAESRVGRGRAETQLVVKGQCVWRRSWGVSATALLKKQHLNANSYFVRGLLTSQRPDPNSPCIFGMVCGSLG